MIENLINKIHNMDCLELMKQIPDGSIDCIITDPPYGIQYLSSWTTNHNEIINDGFEIWQEQIKLWLPEFKRIITPTGCCCCCCGGGGKTPVTALFTIEAIKNFNLIQTLVWRKFVGVGWKYRPSYENIVILSKSKDNYDFYDETNNCSNLIEGINQEIPQKGEHPTQKPIALMRKLIRIHSKEGDTVFDPFLGGGTTAIAAIMEKRNFIGAELSPEYCEMANKRIANVLSAPTMF